MSTLSTQSRESLVGPLARKLHEDRGRHAWPSADPCAWCKRDAAGLADALLSSGAIVEVQDRAANYRLALLQAVVAYDNANQSDLPLHLLDAIRAEVGGPR